VNLRRNLHPVSQRFGNMDGEPLHQKLRIGSAQAMRRNA
jgi:hypothetical protein